MCDIEVNYIQFLVLAQQFEYREYIHLFRMSKIAEGCVPFPTSMSLFESSLLF
jgi:hypothetical protein